MLICHQQSGKVILWYGNFGGKVIGYRLDGQSSVLGWTRIFLFSAMSRLALELPSEYQGLFPQRQHSQIMKLMTHLHLMVVYRMHGSFPLWLIFIFMA
jgi:hypothetical protein